MTFLTWLALVAHHFPLTAAIGGTIVFGALGVGFYAILNKFGVLV